MTIALQIGDKMLTSDRHCKFRNVASASFDSRF